LGKADIYDLVCIPSFGIKLDRPAFSQKSDFDRVNSGLRSEHSLNRLERGLKGEESFCVGMLTSTQEPQVIPSIRNSHFSESVVKLLPRGSFFMRGSSTLPEPVVRVSLDQRLEKAEERVDMGEIFFVMVVIVIVVVQND
jgi:hypothetical protein